MTCPVRSDLQLLSPYVCARDLYKDADVFLDANENAFGSAIDGNVEVSGLELNRYPDSDAIELVGALATYAGVRPDQVMAGNGSDEIISLSLAAVAQRGDNIISVQPGYSMYGTCAQWLGVQERMAQLAPDFTLDADAVLAKVDARTRAVFLSNPGAATGLPLEADGLVCLLESFSGLVFVDEAYVEFGGQSAIRLLDRFDNLLISRTLSKAWGLAGLRVGYAVANEKLIRFLRKIKPPYNIGTLSQALATRALNTGRELMEQNVEKIRKERIRLCTDLEKRGLRAYPGVANFVTVRFPFRIVASQIQQALAQKRLIVRDRSMLPLLDNCIRISVGTRTENDRFLDALDSILEVEPL